MKRGPYVTVERAHEDVDEFEACLSSTDIATACCRVGRSPKTMIRRYDLTNRTPPHGLYYADRRHYPKGT